MTIAPTYPGVYVEEVPSGVRTITGVATSITAFIGRARQGPVDSATRIQSFADFERAFGGLWRESPLSYAVQHFFLHGGKDAVIVRVANGAAPSKIALPAGGEELNLVSSSPGEWANALRVGVDHDIADSSDTSAFNLTVQLLESADQLTSSKAVPAVTEQHRNVSVDPDSPRHVQAILEQASTLVRVSGPLPDDRPDKTASGDTPDVGLPGDWATNDDNGGDGGAITDAQISNAGLEASREGLWALDGVDLFNLLCIPPLAPGTDVGGATTLATAAAYCKRRRAFLIVDSPATWSDTAAAEAGVETLRADIGGARDHAAAYFPRLRMPDPLQENRSADFAPSGAVAGIIARTDGTRGVWKAPAGIEATFAGVREFTFKLDDPGNGRLNPKGLNCLRSFQPYGKVVWGGRTLDGDDRLASEWKYLPVRRLALFLEESLYRGTQWAVFEPNDEPLWAELRLNIGAFMQNLFRQGAFQGQAAKDAYFVKVDKETTTQNDINLGIVNIIVGFAPLKPAEFVILRFQQMAGQLEA
jgi:phage tail sheath protein FI